MRNLIRSITCIILITGFALTTLPQRERSIPIKKTTGFVTEFRAPHEQLFIDIDQNNFIDTENLLLPVNASTRIVDRKGRPIDRQLIRPGMELEINGERYADRIEVSEIKLKTDHEKWNAEAKGYFEALDADKAWIDGRAVKLMPGTLIQGSGHWRGRSYSSFSEMELGATVKVQGVRRADGIIHVTKGEIEPNEFTNGDRRMLDLVQAGMLMPTKLEGGKGKVGGREVTFSNSIELQSYVNKIGNRLVPRYEKDLPADYPGKRVYRFAVIEDDSFNAFALPDGSVFIHTGLLKQIKNEAQLAAIIGHEIAHVTHEHGRKRLEGQEKRQWLSLAAILGGAVVGSQEVALAGVLAVGTLQNHYSRKDEDQADRVGLHYMEQAGYDPREAPKVWREISNKTKGNAVSNLLYSNHPLARNRLKNLNREIAYSHYNSDFPNSKIGTDEYTRLVGGYFGWVRPTSPSILNQTPHGMPLAGGGGIQGTRNALSATTLRSIRSVDFRNFTYQGIGEANKVTLRNGKNLIKGDYSSGEYGSSLTAVRYADFDGDKRLEALVVIDYSQEAAGAYWEQHYYVFKLENGQPRQIFHQSRYKASGYRVVGSSLTVTAPVWRENDAHCCPSQKETITFGPRRGRFVQTSKRLTPWR